MTNVDLYIDDSSHLLKCDKNKLLLEENFLLKRLKKFEILVVKSDLLFGHDSEIHGLQQYFTALRTAMTLPIQLFEDLNRTGGIDSI